MIPIRTASALVGLLIMASSAHAGGWEFKFGGFYKARFGDANGTSTNQGFEALQDAEIHFKPKLRFAAPNGQKIEIGSQIELEATTTSGDDIQIDEYQIFTKGSFGTFRVGATDGAAGYGGTIPCLKFGCGDNGFLAQFGGPVIPAASTSTGDAVKISFFNPTRDEKHRLIREGLFYGVSFVTEGNDEDFEIGLRYKIDPENIGNVTFSFGHTTQNSMDREHFATGIRVKKTLEERRSDDGGDILVDYAVAFVSNKNGDDRYLALGASYIKGPLTYNIHYGQELKVGGEDSEEWKLGFGAQYDLMKYNYVGAVIEFGQNADGTEDFSSIGAFVEFNF